MKTWFDIYMWRVLLLASALCVQHAYADVKVYDSAVETAVNNTKDRITDNLISDTKSIYNAITSNVESGDTKHSIYNAITGTSDTENPRSIYNMTNGARQMGSIGNATSTTGGTVTSTTPTRAVEHYNYSGSGAAPPTPTESHTYDDIFGRLDGGTLGTISGIGAGAGTYTPGSNNVPSTTTSSTGATSSSLRDSTQILNEINAYASDGRKKLQSDATQVAINQAMAEEAYARANKRFDRLQELLDYVENPCGSAAGSCTRKNDLKRMADLQARILAEQAMLMNEQNRLLALGQFQQARRDVSEIRTRQLALQKQGVDTSNSGGSSGLGGILDKAKKVATNAIASAGTTGVSLTLAKAVRGYYNNATYIRYVARGHETQMKTHVYDPARTSHRYVPN